MKSVTISRYKAKVASSLARQLLFCKNKRDNKQTACFQG